MKKMIICKSCGETRQHDAGGLCHNCYQREVNYPKHRDGRLAYGEEYYLKHHDKRLAYGQEYYLKNRDRINKRKRKRYHNGTSDTISIQCNKNGKQYWYYGNGKAIHRVIGEKVLGRKLKSNEVVHHVDNNGLNNAHNNLLICTMSHHMYLHKEMERRSKE